MNSRAKGAAVEREAFLRRYGRSFMRRKRKFVLMAALVAFLLTGCWEGGLNRVINVYTANGGLIARYEGKIDIYRTEGG